MKKFKSKAIEIEAIQWNGENTQEIIGLDPAYFNHRAKTQHHRSTEKLMVKSAHGFVEVSVGDWIIKEPQGAGFYPCNKVLFEKRYEEIV